MNFDRGVAIVGSGNSGLALASGLLADDVPVTLFTRNTTAELLGSHAALTQVTMPSVRVREHQLGLDLWRDSAPAIETVRMRMADSCEGGGAWEFTARLPAPTIRVPGSGQSSMEVPAPATAIDHRLKVASWMQHLETPGRTRRAAKVQPRTIFESDVRAFAATDLFDLLVAAPGAGSDLNTLFAPAPERAGMSERVITQVHLLDYRAPKEGEVTVITCPEGEVMIYPVLTHEPLDPDTVRALSGQEGRRVDVAPLHATCVQIMGRPGTWMDPTIHLQTQERDGTRPEHTGKRHNVLQAQRSWQRLAPELGRIDPDLPERLAGAGALPGSYLLRRLTGQAHHPVTVLSGRPVLGLGDAILPVYPASGQASAASTLSADTVRTELRHLRGQQLTEDNVRGTWEAFWALHGQYTAAFGSFVDAYWAGHLPQHVLTAFAEQVSTPEGADAWAAGLDNPSLLARGFSSHLIT